MNPLTVSVIAVALVLLVTVIAVLIFRFRRPSTVPPATPPAAMPASAFEPQPAYPFEDEWEAQAPYPEYAPHLRSSPSSTYRSAPDTRSANDTHFRQRDTFAFDDVGSIESREASPRHQARVAAQPDAGYPAIRSSLTPLPSPSPSGDAPMRCPHCGSMHLETLNVARMAGGTIGSVAGATSGFALALSGAEAGAAVGAIGGPIGAVFGGLTGAVLAGLLGSAAGNAAGSAVGAAIDENMLDNYRCLSCGHAFGAQHG
ncbi:DNA-directed RNA polymerase subunit RPC12/RpoP [Paraburkholderia sp. GAS206C]|uniref:hypothetical protein n=1 Tax=unclassified Paraburkholderia TaxID=2615204 RepID=UPI003D23674D